jgi:eukaryotic-like serine/threonine-protein kinase
MLKHIGKYDVQDALGRGAMGIVYRGYDRAIARSVAIKVIAKASLDPAGVQHLTERFRHEAQAVGRLVHPRIVQIYDYGEDDEIAYIVMEFVNGKTLSQHLAQEGSYEVREVGEIVRQVLDGIGYAHSEGVVHRDLKLSNILINSDGRVKISDFGIARIESSNLTRVGDVLGTPYCMAPEQFLGQDVNALADLYAVGIVAYELLTGVRPFSGNAAMVMQQVLNRRPADPSKLNPRIAPAMDAVLARALAKSREDRFQSAREFSDAFRSAIDASLALADSDATQRLPAPDAAAVLDAAKLLNPAIAERTGDRTEHVLPSFSGDSAISLDRSVKKARLLIVDDEERILTALKSRFRDRYHVFTTTEPAKALDFLSRYPMHVIISDQRMPMMQGVELLRRSREVSPHSVRILLTGYSDLVAIVGSINEGEVYRFISKPWDNDQLQRIVAEAVTIALELGDKKAAPVELPPRMEAGVLVVDAEDEIFRVARELIGGLCPVLYAPDLDSALASMQEREIAVVITDVEAEHEELTAMLKLLKQENPQILTIVVTRTSDAEMIVELINQAKLFRFLNKPVNVGLLKKHIHTALQRYLAFVQTPELTREHQVDTMDQVRASSFARRILDGAKTLRDRWHAAAPRG